jgi:cytidylate kinase
VTGSDVRSRHPVIAIDGPAGAGKSTVARRLAARLGYAYVNSGAIYRAVAWRVAGGAALGDVLARTRVEFVPRDDGQQVLVDGRDATAELYAPAISELAATLSQRPEVRAFADRLQRDAAARGPVVVEGRDAGTAVFPDAEAKFFLDASLEARARRRLADRRGPAEPGGLAAVQAAIAARDLADRTRPVAPLQRPADSTYVDSSDLTVDQVVERMLGRLARCCTAPCSG